MNEKTASVHWEGQGKKGLGKISTETGALKDYPYGFASRFEDDRRGTNPEEILGAAHAACFTMAFSFACDKAGLASSNVDTQASVRLTKQGAGFAIGRQRGARRKQNARGHRDDRDLRKMVAQGPRRKALPTQLQCFGGTWSSSKSAIAASSRNCVGRRCGYCGFGNHASADLTTRDHLTRDIRNRTV